MRNTAELMQMQRANGSGRLSVILVDDEPLARDSLRIALGAHSDVSILDECSNGDEAVASIRRHKPDVVFLDIEMPGLDGFGVIEAVGVARMPVVVFVTAFHDHALHAFEVHAADYLLKPFDDERLRDALDQARMRISAAAAGDTERRLSELLKEIGRDTARATRFTVRTEERAFIFQARDVDWFEADGNYVWLHVRKERHRLRTTLRSLVEQLDSTQFVRIHKSTVVNVDRIKEVQPWFGGDYVAILIDGRQLKVSRTFAQDILRPVQ